MLSKPLHANYHCQTPIPSRENETSGNPEYWFRSEYFQNRGIYVASFDFFVNWKKNAVCDEVWIKRASDSDDIFTKTAKELRSSIAVCDGQDDCNRLYYFFKHHSITQKYMLFRDVPLTQWENGGERIVQLDLSQLTDDSISYLSVDDVQDQIKQLRQKSVPIGRNGLKYATSSLETYLSTQPYFWPGDCDILLYDEHYNVLAIIEIKKHTKSSKIAFEDQKISNYVNRDQLKYKSLGLLKAKFRTKLFVLYYSVEPEHDYILLEKLTGPYYDLRQDSIQRIALPKKNSNDSLEQFSEAFVKFTGI